MGNNTIQYIAGIDIFKFICAIFVFLLHVTPSASELYYDIIFRYIGRIAVPYFFITSGYLLLKKYDGKHYRLLKRYIFLYVIWNILYLPFALGEITLANILCYLKKIVIIGGYGQLWYLHGIIIAGLMCVWLYKKVSIKQMCSVGMVLYIIGLINNTYNGISDLLFMDTFLYEMQEFIMGIIETTRNGIFFGLIFMEMGFFYAWGGHIEFHDALFGFFVSMLLLLAESQIAKYFNMAGDMYICLLPVGFFMFAVSLNISNVGCINLCKTLGKLSSLIFFLHIGVRDICYQSFIGQWIEKAPLRHNRSIFFFYVLICTIGLSILIIRISKIKYFKFLEKIY